MEKLGQKWKARLVSTNGFHLIDHDGHFFGFASALTFTAEHHMIYYLFF